MKRGRAGKRILLIFFLILVSFSTFSNYSLFPRVEAAKPFTQLALDSKGQIIYENSFNSQNLAIIPYDWHYSGTDVEFGTGPQITHVDYTVFNNENVSIRIDPHTSSDMNVRRELNTYWTPCKPGDRIIFSCWIKTTSAANPANNGNPVYGGAKIGIDFFGHTNQLGGGHPTDEEHYSIIVPWGSDWTYREWNIIVPADTYYVNYAYGTPGFGEPIEPQTIIGFIAWMQVTPVAETGVGWFADAELYINSQ